MLLEFLLGIRHAICFVRIDILVLISSFGFDVLFLFVSRCLFFAMTFRVVPHLTSTYECLRVCVGVLSWPFIHRYNSLHSRNQAEIVMVPSSCS